MFARTHGYGHFSDEGPMLFQSRTMIRPQFENRQPPARWVLLMAEILVANNEKIKPSGLSFTEQVTIFQVTPTHFQGRMHLMTLQCLAHLPRRADVEQHLHRASSAAMRSQP